jgi:cell division protein FtsW
MSNRIQKRPILGLDEINLPYKHGDPIFLVALVSLCIIGLLLVFSSSSYKADQIYHNPFYFLKSHALRLAFGLIMFFAAYRLDYHSLRRWSRWGLMLWAGMLLLVLALPPTRNGTHRSLDLFGFSLQPSEFARVGLLIYLADWCSRHANRLEKTWSAFLLALGIILAPVALVVIEPSFSQALMLAASGIIVLFLAGAQIKRLILVAVAAIPVGLVVALLKGYRELRFTSFFNPEADPKGSGYHVLQSLIAVGSGRLWGLGPGMSGQKKGFLPEAHCDFIYSILCEEIGFIGGLLLLLLFLIFVWRGARIAWKAPDQFGFLLAAGLLFSIVLFIMVNISVTLGLIPVTGLPLPFVSYGGSALIANLISCGIIMNVSRHAQSPEAI